MRAGKSTKKIFPSPFSLLNILSLSFKIIYKRKIQSEFSIKEFREKWNQSSRSNSDPWGWNQTFWQTRDQLYRLFLISLQDDIRWFKFTFLQRIEPMILIKKVLSPNILCTGALIEERARSRYRIYSILGLMNYFESSFGGKNYAVLHWYSLIIVPLMRLLLIQWFLFIEDKQYMYI